ncbi:hypothetical protein ACFYSC_10910 [Streptosporangium sp. NPDC004379]|uniref:hypothetical protein n=1 Tax=Streptosporangium sp. NPDC004379 TaxID=3366189 RepID=UPI0036B2AC92
MADNGEKAARGGAPREVGFTEGKVKELGGSMGQHVQPLKDLSTRTKGFTFDWPGCGVLGIGIDSAHSQACNEGATALDAAAATLESWQHSLAESDKFYKDADEHSKIKDPGGGGKDKDPGPGSPSGRPDIESLLNGSPSGGSPTGPGSMGPGGGLPGGGLPAPHLNGGLPGPGSGVPGLDGVPPGTDPSKAGPGAPGTNMPGADLPRPHIPDPNTTVPNVPVPNTSTPNVPTPNVPDLNGALPGRDQVDPSRYTPNTTHLAGYDPNDLLAQQARQAQQLQNAVPPNWPGDQGGQGQPPGNSQENQNNQGNQGNQNRGSQGGGYGGSSLSQAVRPSVTGAPGAPGMGGMPMMPPMGGGAPGGKDEEREPSGLLRGSEQDWEDDMDIAPSVISHEA